MDNFHEICFPLWIIVNGVIYIHPFLSPEIQHHVSQHIEKHPWISIRQKRRQLYGTRFYLSNTNKWVKGYPTPFPEWLSLILQPVQQWLPTVNKATVTEYWPGQDSPAHIDNTVDFGDAIACVSLLSDAVMVFRNGDENEAFELRPGSLLVMRGEARYKWTHEIQPVKQRRMVISFREAIDQPKGNSVRAIASHQLQKEKSS